MNILIVDDDRFVVAALRSGIDWENLGFSNIYTANNISEAQSIIEENTIHLLLSDIDMPHGSGLDLLTWIREQHNDMIVILLTNYADFHYAQKAVSLKSFHYFLKPIEFDKLTKIIQDATLQIDQRSVQVDKNCNHFWTSYIKKDFFYKQERLEYYSKQLHLPYTPDDIFLPIMFDLFPHYLTPENELKSYFETTTQQFRYLKTTYVSVFTDFTTSNVIFLEDDVSSSQYLAILKLSSEEVPSPILIACERFMETVSSQTHCSLNCLVGIPSTLEKFHTNFKTLNILTRNFLNVQKLILQSKYCIKEQECPPIDAAILEVYLDNEQFSSFLDYAVKYMQRLSDSGNLNYQSINSLQIDIVQIIYAFLKSKGILAHKLFHTESYHILANNAKNSIYDMELYLRYILFVAKGYLTFSASKKSVAKSIQDYVELHYAEDIGRSSITDILYLDPDYASKLFKKEVGISLGNYIIQKRIEAAKNLLLTTNLPINTIADNVGYGNYSYFIRLFKKFTKMTPVEFRNHGDRL